MTVTMKMNDYIYIIEGEGQSYWMRCTTCLTVVWWSVSKARLTTSVVINGCIVDTAGIIDKDGSRKDGIDDKRTEQDVEGFKFSGNDK